MTPIITEETLVVVPCLNEEDGIARILDSVFRDEACDRLLVVVADGGSSDRTREIIQRFADRVPNIRLIDNPQKLQSAGINLAVKLFGAGKRWLVRLDAHADYPANYISNLIAEAQKTQASSVVVAMNSHGKSCLQSAIATAQNSLLGAGGAPHRVVGSEGYVDHGHHALFDMNSFRALDGYDEMQSHNEDAEFDVRLARQGGRIWLTRKARLVYYPRSGIGRLFSQYRNYGYGRATTILRHGLRPKLRQLLPAAVAPALACLAAAPLLPVSALPAGLWLCVCIAYGGFLALKTGNVCAFGSGPLAMVMHFAWSIGFWRALLRAPVQWIVPDRLRFQ